MHKIELHPILEIPKNKEVTFLFNGKKIVGHADYTIAAALHQAGFPVHSHSLDGRERSLECGIGKCGACEMLVDGKIKRICITKVDGVKEVAEVNTQVLPKEEVPNTKKETRIYKTRVAIIGAGPAGLACREELNKLEIPNIVIDNNDRVGGQFNMQTHQFFFFEKEKLYGGLRGFEISLHLAGEDHTGIFLNSTVWDLLEGKRVAVKNMLTEEIYYVDAEYLVVATGAVPFMPAFENDDLPGVYTAAVMQKMMNVEHTLLGKRILSIGAGNIGYLTSYQAMQAGAQVVAIIEAMDREGGFPVQANRVRRLGIPVLTSHILLKAIPNEDNTGIIGAVVAECKNFAPIPGTEKVINDIDVINICTGLIPDDQLLIKGRAVFGEKTFGVGDAVRVGEGTCAVLRGKQAAMEIAMACSKRLSYDAYLELSKEYIDSQQHPTRILEKPNKPSAERMHEKPFVVADCLYGFACNPCVFACPKDAIQKSSTSTVPVIDYEKCIGCMDCVAKCPGLAIFGYNLAKNQLFLPIENFVEENAEVFLVNNQGEKLGEGIIEKVLLKPNKTNIVRVKSLTLTGDKLTEVTGFITKENYPKPLNIIKNTTTGKAPTYICHCDDVELEAILGVIGDRKMISVDELKHIVRVGMGACRGKRCIPRVRQILRSKGIELVGDATPRAPLSNQVNMSELYPASAQVQFITDIRTHKTRRVDCEVFIAGGGIAGSGLFRYFAENGKKCVLANAGHGGSWRNIAGGRPAFSTPEIADMAQQNLHLFKELQKNTNINFKPIRYVGFAHDEATYKALEASKAWSNAYMVDKKDFQKEVTPYFNPNLNTYQAALITHDCWQATPGLVLDALRTIGLNNGGILLDNTTLVEVQKTAHGFMALVLEHDKTYTEYHCEHFVNALGENAAHFASQLGIETGLYPVKHQAFITKRLPLIGKDGDALDMLIDRRNYKGFSAVYGQQLAETGQIIGCASPACDPIEAHQNLHVNSKEFMEIVSEIFTNWIPQLGGVTFQTFWAGYYVEPRYIIDPENGLFIGLRGHGFMLGQYLAKIYVDKYLGKPVPEYMNRLALNGEGLCEGAFK
ncbi:MAG: FAD-dependent oxidoreductase [Bacteroidetes bacterium]|nr:FAD-dependent oxidoreductase [Bacteroidota bacterium]MCL2301968.1 FAD-dependent oxidoreductase [Lentimicrobiaceae bacterium]